MMLLDALGSCVAAERNGELISLVSSIFKECHKQCGCINVSNNCFYHRGILGQEKRLCTMNYFFSNFIIISPSVSNEINCES